jgi:hypothetical protein
MFTRWLEKTRQKSDDQKRVIALSISFVITSFIFAVWLFSFMQTNVDSIEKEAVESTASPIQAFKNIFKNLVE